LKKKGIGTNEDQLIRAILGVDNAARQKVKDKYLELYGKALIDDLKDEIKEDFLIGVLALLEQSDIYEAKNVKHAINQVGLFIFLDQLLIQNEYFFRLNFNFV
jgi:hypothetical protein